MQHKPMHYHLTAKAVWKIKRMCARPVERLISLSLLQQARVASADPAYLQRGKRQNSCHNKAFFLGLARVDCDFQTIGRFWGIQKCSASRLRLMIKVCKGISLRKKVLLLLFFDYFSCLLFIFAFVLQESFFVSFCSPYS